MYLFKVRFCFRQNRFQEIWIIRVVKQLTTSDSKMHQHPSKSRCLLVVVYFRMSWHPNFIEFVNGFYVTLRPVILINSATDMLVSDLTWLIKRISVRPRFQTSVDYDNQVSYANLPTCIDNLSTILVGFINLFYWQYMRFVIFFYNISFESFSTSLTQELTRIPLCPMPIVIWMVS